METSPLSLAEGRRVIERYARDMPHAPGVYRMIDAKGAVLYVGKAKHLKNRVTSYLNVAVLTTRIQRMIMQTASMDIITTRSEAEALLLEANLIKKYTPRYNVLLKDDKSFPYIFLSGQHAFARIGKHRGAKIEKGKYFGPFVSAHAVDETITLMQKIFLLRTCSDSFFKQRTRPCMLYQIKRCSAPCVGKITEEHYARLVAQAQAFLSGKSRQIQDEMVQEMQALSLKMDYEKARVVRDRIRALTEVQQQHGIEGAAMGDADIIALAREGNDVCLQLFSFRGGRNYGNRAWFPAQAGMADDAEIIRNFIAQHYQTQPPPGLILTSHMLEEAALLEEALRINTDYKIEIVYPLRGEKRERVLEAARNAHEALMRHVSLQAATREVLADLQRVFALDELPARIEVYDNSHIQGAHAVGAMIVAGPDGYIKKEYRTFTIKNEALTPGDDYAMLREVLLRRFRKWNEAGEEVRRPSLALIDGGQGQLGVAMAVFAELGIEGIPLAAIAKGPDRNAGREWFFLPGREPFQLPENDRLLHFLQRLRDEAHRFAIGAHRGKRSRAIVVSELDTIPSIGPRRKRALLHHFGSARAVSGAGIDDILAVPGINRSLAELIYNHFHG